MLDEDQVKELEHIAREQHISKSKLIRQIITQGLQERKRKRLEEAAEALSHEYDTNPELRIFNALDGEDFHA